MLEKIFLQIHFIFNIKTTVKLLPPNGLINGVASRRPAGL